jgi:hypothetical protein
VSLGASQQAGSRHITNRSLILFALSCVVLLSAGCKKGATGTIYLTTVPLGATIYLDNSKLGETPLEFQWNAKTPATLRIEKEGYIAETEWLDGKWLRIEKGKGNFAKHSKKSGDTTLGTWKVRTTRTLRKAE